DPGPLPQPPTQERSRRLVQPRSVTARQHHPARNLRLKRHVLATLGHCGPHHTRENAVLTRGLEPPRVSPYGPEPYASANSATRANSSVSKMPTTVRRASPGAGRSAPNSAI